MFDKLLVPLDGSSLAECVLPHAAKIARASDSQIYFLRVLDPISAATRPRSVDPFDWQVRKAEAESYLKNVASRFDDIGLRSNTVILEGKAAENIIDFAHTNGINLIIMSSHGQSGISGWNVSSVVQKVILRAQTSIMIVRAYQHNPQSIEDFEYQRILLPLDGSQRAEYVLPLATSIAGSGKTEIIIAHIVKKPEMPRRTPLSQDDMALINELTERNRVEASKYIEDLESRFDCEVDTRLMVSDHVGSSLHQIVEQDDVDLVILSAHGYSGESRWPYGRTVVSFIAYGTTPLLVVQDLPSDRIEPTQAELAAQEKGGR
jgi:nucleotide-binding universal stress UspA family protein